MCGYGHCVGTLIGKLELWQNIPCHTSSLRQVAESSSFSWCCYVCRQRNLSIEARKKGQAWHVLGVHLASLKRKKKGDLPFRPLNRDDLVKTLFQHFPLSKSCYGGVHRKYCRLDIFFIPKPLNGKFERKATITHSWKAALAILMRHFGGLHESWRPLCQYTLASRSEALVDLQALSDQELSLRNSDVIRDGKSTVFWYGVHTSVFGYSRKFPVRGSSPRPTFVDDELSIVFLDVAEVVTIMGTPKSSLQTCFLLSVVFWWRCLFSVPATSQKWSRSSQPSLLFTMVLKVQTCLRPARKFWNPVQVCAKTSSTWQKFSI